MKIKDLRIGSLIEAKQSSNIFESGFIKVNFKVLERLTFFPNQIESSVFGVKITNDVLLNKDINFVHQLQDVFEYVTGNELNIEIFFE